MYVRTLNTQILQTASRKEQKDTELTGAQIQTELHQLTLTQ